MHNARMIINLVFILPENAFCLEDEKDLCHPNSAASRVLVQSTLVCVGRVQRAPCSIRLLLAFAGHRVAGSAVAVVSCFLNLNAGIHAAEC
mmetsp:Transcript_17249/g.37242  ORF Transcript_17249/g.37242 Transcript_17249/m.37242 type:complete len:91 (+) Transcript_17249:2014-2286(+)